MATVFDIRTVPERKLTAGQFWPAIGEFPDGIVFDGEFFRCGNTTVTEGDWIVSPDGDLFFVLPSALFDFLFQK